MKKKILLSLITTLVCSIFSAQANQWANDPSHVRTKITYKDVPETYWGYTAICDATNSGWFSGYGDGTFKPEHIITRAEASKAVSNLLKLKPVTPITQSYADVDLNSWYSPYIQATKDMFFPAYGNEFKPSLNMTREDAMYLLVEAYGYDSLLECVDESILDTFADASTISEDHKKHVAVAVIYGLTAGYSDNTLRPRADLTRAQFATLLDRLYITGPNHVTTTSKLERVEITSGTQVSIPLNSRAEIHAEAIYEDGTRTDFTNNLNIYTEDNEYLQIVSNRVYALKKGVATVKFNNLNVYESVTVTID